MYRKRNHCSCCLFYFLFIYLPGDGTSAIIVEAISSFLLWFNLSISIVWGHQVVISFYLLFFCVCDRFGWEIYDAIYNNRKLLHWIARSFLLLCTTNSNENFREKVSYFPQTLFFSLRKWTEKVSCTFLLGPTGKTGWWWNQSKSKNEIFDLNFMLSEHLHVCSLSLLFSFQKFFILFLLLVGDLL